MPLGYFSRPDSAGHGYRDRVSQWMPMPREQHSHLVGVEQLSGQRAARYQKMAPAIALV